MSGHGRHFSVEDWCQVKLGIFCGGLVSGQGRHILWRTGVR